MIAFGTTRVVIILLTMVIKVPIFWRGAKVYHKGVLGNLDERNLWKIMRNTPAAAKLAPTWFSFFGYVNIMERAEPYQFDSAISDEENARVLLLYFDDVPIEIDICSRHKNFGLYRGKIVLIDYTQTRESKSACDHCYCKSIT